MTLDLPTVIAIGTACLFVGGQLAILAQVVRSNRDQGRRLGSLEDWRAATNAVQRYRDKRTLSRATGIPVVADDETPT